MRVRFGPVLILLLSMGGCGRLGFNAVPPERDAGPDGEADAAPALPCENSVQDGDEEGVDCGGSCPASCSTAYACEAQTVMLPSECWALVALYESTAGEGWLDNTGWLTDSPCRWAGVRCLAGHVAAIRLGENRLNGSVPPSIGALRFLIELVLGAGVDYESCQGSVRYADRNQLGNLPAEFGALTELEVLNLNCAAVTGMLPIEIAAFSKLRYLKLYQNELTGMIPPALGDLSYLRILELDSNAFTGPVPAALGNLVQLEELWLRGNQLTGSIPPELGNLSMVSFFNLGNNQLSGVVPAELMAVSGTRSFRLRGNQCLTASGATFLAWLTEQDPLWNDGCP